jgi:DNA-directed RNA polymerase specialized sigma24 family protein
MVDSTARAARGDAELISATVSGDEASFAVLYERHLAAARKLAGFLCGDPAEVERIIMDAFTRMRNALRDGGGPRAAVRPYLFTTVRWSASALLAGAAGGPAALVPGQESLFACPAEADLVTSPVYRSFMGLPEQLRAALWHAAIEPGDPAQTRAILGRDDAGVAELTGQARAGLCKTLLAWYVSSTALPQCASARAALGAGADGALTGLREPAVQQHLRGCPDCRTAADDLASTDQLLRRAVAPVFLGAPAGEYLSAAKAESAGLRWIRAGSHRTKQDPRRRYILTGSAAVLVAIAVIAVALDLTASNAPQGIPQTPAASTSLDPIPTTAPPGSPSPSPSAKPTSRASRGSRSGSSSGSSPAPQPTTTSQGPPAPRQPTPSPTPAPQPTPTPGPTTFPW